MSLTRRLSGKFSGNRKPLSDARGRAKGGKFFLKVLFDGTQQPSAFPRGGSVCECVCVCVCVYVCVLGFGATP